ncbi:MAG TPA: T9SS type A sorting domain-containing protein, partial [Phaeodactylibacter sp.]|nr:T9SS type A sorting domain-containing protein [Phaeodactylibacter sp.]
KATIANGRQYVEQKGTSISKEFVVEWTAPESGDVTFYYGGNAVNNNNMTGGDNAIMGSSSFTVMPTATNDLEKVISLEVLPNPVNERFNLVANAQVADTYELSLFAQNGRKVFTKKINISIGENFIPIEMNNLSVGVYHLILSDGKNLVTKKVVKR